MVSIVDYDKIYGKQIDILDENYWGIQGEAKVSDSIKASDIVKLAIDENRVIGFLHFKQIGDLIDCHHILVAEDYQKQGVATNLFLDAMKEIEKRDIKTLVAHAVEHNGKINAMPLLKKFGFRKIYRVKNYWKSLYPEDYCKQCESADCKCGVVVFLKKL